MLSTRDTIISTLQKDNLDHERLEKVLRNQKQILANKNADLRSGDVPNTVKNRIVENTLRGKHLYMTSRIFLEYFLKSYADDFELYLCLLVITNYRIH